MTAHTGNSWRGCVQQRVGMGTPDVFLSGTVRGRSEKARLCRELG